MHDSRTNTFAKSTYPQMIKKNIVTEQRDFNILSVRRGLKTTYRMSHYTNTKYLIKFIIGKTCYEN